MKIVTYDGKIYRTTKIEVGGWDEKHDKYRHDRLVFFDEDQKEWVNLKANDVVHIFA